MSIGLSIVIPTKGRAKLVVDLLASIKADADTLDGDIEVLVIDDSPAGDAAEITAAAMRCGARYVASPTGNVGGKRNLGVDMARHELVLFLDSDVTVRPGTLKAHFDRLSSASPDVVACLGKVTFFGERTMAWRAMEVMQLTLPFAYPDYFETVPWGPTANLSVRRTAFQEIGGFDVEQTNYGGEDVDLGLRWGNAGRIIVTARAAEVFHAIETWSTWRANLHRLWCFGSADYFLLSRHPERAFFDFPTAPMIWLAEIALVVPLMIAGKLSPLVALLAIALSILAYPAVYAACKRGAGTSWLVHVFGPLIFWTMDAAKAVEAVRAGRPKAIFQRLLYLDDLIAQDWPEVSASAWGVTAATLVFVTAVVLSRL